MDNAPRFDPAPRTRGHERRERPQPLNPWLLLAAGALVVLLILCA